MRQALAVFGVAVVLTAGFGAQAPKPVPGVSLGDLTWAEAEPYLTAASVVVIPLGPGAVEQGLHLKLNSAERLARYLAGRVQPVASVVVAPPLTYSFHPEFAEYPGTASLTSGTTQSLVVDVAKGFAKHGARRFYVLNTDPSALGPLSSAAKVLADDGLLLGYLDPAFRLQRSTILRQTPIRVAHADEALTSMMLFVDPSAVDMARAARQYSPGTGVLTRQEGGRGVFSPSGVLGDATLATREKGQQLIDTLVAAAVEDIEAVKTAPLPAAKVTQPPPPPPPTRPAGPPAERVNPNGCTAGEERDIRLLGMRFGSIWREMDPVKIGFLFTKEGDMRHPDGTIERGPDTIIQNRIELFKKKEYRGSIHPIQLNDIRCLPGGVAIADGKWELRLADAGTAKPYAGWCTLILRNLGTWQIEAWRYTVDPPPNTTPAPTILKKPGWPGGPGGE
jgi:creatinine amidohydrolase